MAVTPDDVRHVARLARIEVQPSEIEDVARDLAAILGWVATLPDVPDRPAAPAALRLRPDDARDTDPGPLLDAAPEVRDRLIAVSRVVD